MKIVIISRYPPFPGGRENFVFELANQLSHKNKVLVLTPDDNFSEKENISVRKYIEDKEYLTEIIRDFNPDIINSHTFYLSKTGIKIAKEIGVPFVITLHGDQFVIGNKQRQELVTEVVKASDFVITVSNNGKESLIKNIQGVDKDKIIVIKNGVNISKFCKSELEQKEKNRKEYNIPLNKKVVVIPIRLNQGKGLDFLIDTIVENKIKFEEDNFLFLVSVPDFSLSQEESELFAELKEKIQKEGIESLLKFIFLDYESVRKAYWMSDIFLLPSRSEQFPMSILEAMSIGLPIIATSVGGIPEVVDNRVIGLLVEFGNTKELFDSLELIRNDSVFKDSLIKNASEKIIKFSLENVAVQYTESYSSFINKLA